MAGSTSGDYFCNLCTQNDKTTIAAIWCYQCHENLCLECEQHHKRAKMSRKHLTVSVHDHNKQPKLLREIPTICDDHEEILDSYCVDHNIPCCRRCVLSTHKKCSDVQILEDVIKSVKTSGRFEKVTRKIQEMRKNVDIMKCDRKQRKEELSKEEMRIRSDFGNLRKTVNSCFNKLEEKVVADIKYQIKTETKSVKKTLQKLEKIEKDVSDISFDVDTLRQCPSDMQVFFGIELLETKIVTMDQSVIAFKESGKLNNKIFKLDSDLLIDKFSKIAPKDIISVSSSENNISFVDKDTPQAQIQLMVPPVAFENIRLKKVNKIQFEGITRFNFICGCAYLTDEKILIGEYNSTRYYDRLIIIDSSGSVKEINFSNTNNSIFDITTSNDKKSVAISSRSSVIHIVNIAKSSIKRTLVADGDVNGIAFGEDKLYACILSQGIQCLDLHQKDCKPVHIFSFKFSSYSYLDYHEKHLYYTKNESGIGCCSLKGEEIWTFNENFLQTRGIAVDKYGNVFIVDGIAEKVFVVSRDGSKCKELLDESDWLSTPRALSYDCESNRIVVCNHQIQAIIYEIK